ncbi:MAG: C39 family peptidase [Patescibacteria group bacterium]
MAVDKSREVTRKQSPNKENANQDFEKKEKKELPTNFFLDVPFVMQAPFANWDEHNESCEEAGLLLANYFYRNEKLSKDTANEELKEMVAFQKNNYGAELDIYAMEMAKLATDFYGYDEPRVFKATKQSIVQEIVSGNPVIVPTTAAFLKPEKNDYPEMGYHVVVIVGYDETGYIVHDPGTYTGENTHYSYLVMEKAMADYGNEVLVLR